MAEVDAEETEGTQAEVMAEKRLTRLKGQEGQQLLTKFRENKANFEAQLRQQWALALDLYDLILYEAQHAAAHFNKVYRPEAAKKKDALFEVVTRLQARACLIASEVRALLVSGHGEGATARWRSIHEVLVVLLLIVEHRSELAERYLLYDTVQTLSNIRDYNNSCDELGLSPHPQQDIDRLEAAQADLVARFGKPFTKSNGWAADVLKQKGGVSITMLEKAVNLQRMRIFYAIASNPIHSNVKGFSSTELLIGPSPKGLAAPAQYTLVELVECTTQMLRLRPSFDHAVLEIELERLLKDASKELLRISQQELDK